MARANGGGNYRDRDEDPPTVSFADACGPLGPLGQRGKRGPLGKRVWLRYKTPAKGEATAQLYAGNTAVGNDANALIVLRRLAFAEHGKSPKPHVPLHEWATVSNAGQKMPDKARPEDVTLLRRVLDRRMALIEGWTTPRRSPRAGEGDPVAGAARRGHAARMALKPEWRLITGLGQQFGMLDSGIALHGTYGWPVIPASSLKGLAAAGARLAEADEVEVRRLLGDPRPDNSPANQSPRGLGSVVFLDALPAEAGVTVHSDVITPHQQPYYTDTMSGSHNDPRPPGEHHNPVPVPFLSVSGAFRVDLLGSAAEDLSTVCRWLEKVGDDAGAGGRTTAGYGYFAFGKASPPKEKKDKKAPSAAPAKSKKKERRR